MNHDGARYRRRRVCQLLARIAPAAARRERVRHRQSGALLRSRAERGASALLKDNWVSALRRSILPTARHRGFIHARALRCHRASRRSGQLQYSVEKPLACLGQYSNYKLATVRRSLCLYDCNPLAQSVPADSRTCNIIAVKVALCLAGPISRRELRRKAAGDFFDDDGSDEAMVNPPTCDRCCVPDQRN